MKSFLLGALAEFKGMIFIHHFEIVKARLQFDSKPIGETAQDLYRDFGFIEIYSGLSAALLVRNKETFRYVDNNEIQNSCLQKMKCMFFEVFKVAKNEIHVF